MCNSSQFNTIFVIVCSMHKCIGERFQESCMVDWMVSGCKHSMPTVYGGALPGDHRLISARPSLPKVHGSNIQTACKCINSISVQTK